MPYDFLAPRLSMKRPNKSMPRHMPTMVLMVQSAEPEIVSPNCFCKIEGNQVIKPK